MQTLDPAKPFAPSVRKIAHHYLGRTVELLGEQRAGFHESVHESRKNLKRVRALLKLVESADGAPLKAIRKDIAAAARTLSEHRNAAALVECTTKLARYLEGRQAGDIAGPLREAVERRRDLLALESHDAARMVAPALKTCRKAMADIDEVELEGAGAAEVLAKGRRENIKKARRALRSCHKTTEPENFHELRKCAQATLFQAGFLRAAWPFAFDEEAARAKHIAEILGHEHDIEVLSALLDSEPHLFAAITDKKRLNELLAERRSALRHDALKVAGPLFEERPREAGKRLERLWPVAENA